MIRGSAPGWWTTIILKYILKAVTSETAADQRPLGILNSSIQWLTTVILLQLCDVVQQVTSAAQKGFLLGRQIIDHTVGAVEFSNQSTDCLLVAVNIAKAYDLV